MNLIITYNNFDKIVLGHDDKTLNRQLLEVTRILVSACTRLKPRFGKPKDITLLAKDSYVDLVLSDRDKAENIVDLGYALKAEYIRRFNKDHMFDRTICACFDTLHSHYHLPIRIEVTAPALPNNSPIKVKGLMGEVSIYESYKAYMNNLWNRDNYKPVWTNRQSPSWARLKTPNMEEVKKAVKKPVKSAYEVLLDDILSTSIPNLESLRTYSDASQGR